jgi:hypothetical protein
MSTHSERPGHCAECAVEIAKLELRVEHLEKLVEQLDDVLSEIVREQVPVPTALPTEVTAKERRKA